MSQCCDCGSELFTTADPSSDDLISTASHWKRAMSLQYRSHLLKTHSQPNSLQSVPNYNISVVSVFIVLL